MTEEFLAQYGGFGGSYEDGRRQLQRLPEAKLTEEVSIDDYGTWRATRFAAAGGNRMKAARRPERREEIEGSFRVPKNRMLNVTGTEGGWNINLAAGGTQPPSIISLIPLRLSLTHRTHPRRSSKIGEDDSDPPQSGGSCGPDSGTVEHAPIAAPWGRYRPH